MDDFTAKIFYQSFITINLEDFAPEGVTYREAQKREFAEYMKPYLSNSFVLTINNEESLYEEEEN